MNLGKAIKLERKKRHMNQEELAKACGVTLNAISHIELGVCFPSSKTLNAILGVFGMSEAKLFIASIGEEDAVEGSEEVFLALKKATEMLMK